MVIAWVKRGEVLYATTTYKNVFQVPIGLYFYRALIDVTFG